MYIFFSEQSKKGCQVANGKPLCGASPGEDWPYYWRSSTGWACCCMFKQSVSKKRFPCTDRDFIVMQIRSAENKAQVKWLTAKCYPYFIHNCSLETIKNANIAFFLVSSFWGEEWYLEKCGSRKILARSGISELAFDGSQVSFSGDFCVSPVPIFVIVVVVVVVVFCRRVLESRICRFFFPFSIQEKNFSEFMGTAYRTESSILVGLSS